MRLSAWVLSSTATPSSGLPISTSWFSGSLKNKAASRRSKRDRLCRGLRLNACPTSFKARRSDYVSNPTGENSESDPDPALVPATPQSTPTPRDHILAAMAIPTTHKIAPFDIDRCLKTVNATKLLQALWRELNNATNVNPQYGLEVCRRVSTYVLTMPRRDAGTGRLGGGPGVQGPGMPLLPVFMHLILPSVLTTIDRQVSQVGGQQIQLPLIELITTVIFSSLTAALHLEWAMSTVLPKLSGAGGGPAEMDLVSPQSHTNAVSVSPKIAHNAHNKTNTSVSGGSATTAPNPNVATTANPSISASSSTSQAPNTTSLASAPATAAYLGASTSTIARRLAHDLRSRKDSEVCSMILQRLASSQSFVANFPHFGAEMQTQNI